MRHTRVFLVLMVSVMAGTLFTGMAAAETSKAAGQVMAVAGPVTVAREDVTPHQLKFRDNLFWRDVVEARKNGIARVLLGGKATGPGAVANPRAGTGRAERIGAYEAVRVSGRQDPIRFQVSANELRVLLKGLTPPRPPEARSGGREAAVAGGA